jgi:nucleoside-diphosphate-sugar epimerase
MREVYVEGLRQVLQAMPAPARLVYVSSTGVYGQTTGEEVDEDATTEPLEESGQVVLEAERLLRRYRPDAIVLRFAGIYGPNRLLRAAALRAGTPLAIDPEKWLNLIHVEDGAQAAIRAEENGAPGSVFNVSDDRPVRRREFYTRLAEVLGTPAPHFVPWEESAAHDRANRRIVNARLRRQLGVQLRYPSFLEGLPASR